MGASNSKKDWKPDSSTTKCYKCSSSFTATKRRHHCRYCGEIFCADCTKKSSPIPRLGITEKVRVCDDCYTLILVLDTNSAEKPQQPKQQQQTTQKQTAADTNGSSSTAATPAATAAATANTNHADPNASTDSHGNGHHSHHQAASAAKPPASDPEAQFENDAQQTITELQLLDCAQIGIEATHWSVKTDYLPREMDDLDPCETDDLFLPMPESVMTEGALAALLAGTREEPKANKFEIGASDADWLNSHLKQHLSTVYA